MSNFQQPGISSPEDSFKPNENNGALLLFFPTRLDTGIKTAHGESDAVAARVVRLNDGRVWDNALIFSTALVTQLKGAIPDGMVLGTLGQGENTKGNPPWLLRPHNDQDVATAEAWMAANPRIQQAPQPAAPAGAPAWNAPATPAAPQWGGAPAPAAAPAAPAWGAPAPAATPPATGWGGAPADAVNPAAAGWGAPAAPAPAAPPAPAAFDPNAAAAALQAKGVALPPGTTVEQLQQLAAMYGV